MFEEHYKDGSFAGENSRNYRLIAVRVGIFLAIGAVTLLAVGYQKWSKASLHERLLKRHAVATAYYDRPFYKNVNGGTVTYSIGYTFMVDGKTYRNNEFFKTAPTSPEGIVHYDPDDPEENELQPF
jgi:hypothetical protein